MDDYRRRVVRQVRKLRAEKGWSQEQLAGLWGHSRHTVLRLEQGKGDMDLDVLSSLAETFGRPLVEFLAPILSPERSEEIVRDAVNAERDRLQRAINVQAVKLLDAQLQAGARVEVRTLLGHIMRAARQMTAEELGFQCEFWQCWADTHGAERQARAQNEYLVPFARAFMPEGPAGVTEEGVNDGDQA
jgi:transcriptional regulator with XRE-family HTH domain